MTDREQLPSAWVTLCELIGSDAADYVLWNETCFGVGSRDQWEPQLAEALARVRDALNEGPKR